MKFREIRISDEAKAAAAAAIAAGQLVSGPWIERVEEKMKQIAGTRHAIAVGSGTMALKIALDAAGIQPGDVVIVPDITFIACATVVLELSALPVFVDVDPDTLMPNRESIERAIAQYGDRVKVIMAVRLGGEEVPEWIYEMGRPVLIDSAHSMSSIPMKAFAVCYSFYPTKIISGIEGGCIATNLEALASRARRLRLFGFPDGSRKALELGYKANMSNVSAALISYELDRLGNIIDARSAIRDYFNAEFSLKRTGIGMYMVLVDDPDAIAAQIPAIRHYPAPLSLQILNGAHNANANWISQHLISLPFHEWINQQDKESIAVTIKLHLITHTE